MGNGEGDEDHPRDAGFDLMTADGVWNVAVVAFPHRPAATVEEPMHGAGGMDDVVDSPAAMGEVTETEFDAALDEALDEQRRRGR